MEESLHSAISLTMAWSFSRCFNLSTLVRSNVRWKISRPMRWSSATSYSALRQNSWLDGSIETNSDDRLRLGESKSDPASHPPRLSPTMIAVHKIVCSIPEQILHTIHTRQPPHGWARSVNIHKVLRRLKPSDHHREHYGNQSISNCEKQAQCWKTWCARCGGTRSCVTATIGDIR